MKNKKEFKNIDDVLKDFEKIVLTDTKNNEYILIGNHFYKMNESKNNK